MNAVPMSANSRIAEVPTGRPTAGWLALDPAGVAHVLAELELDPARLAAVSAAPRPARPQGLLGALEAGARCSAEAARELAQLADQALEEHGALLLFLHGQRDDRELSALRNQLWPALHVVALYSIAADRTRRRTVRGQEPIAGTPERAQAGVLVVARRTRDALAPETTVEKFDANAAGWNGRPGTPGYAHFRWMRRFVVDCARSRPGARILDFGSGAGWVGVEAAQRFAARELCAFDPSPAMVAIVQQNADAAGITAFRGLTGFGEAPPFPEEGEQPYDLVLSSGVISFSPDVERCLDGLAATVRVGGELVIGDIHRESRGFRRRRAERPLLPVREMNARTRAEVRAQLEARGFVHEASAGYQLTRPVPELMHLSETRLRGGLSAPLLWLNRAAAGLDRKLGGRFDDCFDSWVMRLRRER